MFYNKDQKKAEPKPVSEPEAEPAKAKKGPQKKEKDPVEAKQDEEAVAKKKPKGRPAASSKASDEESPKPAPTPGIHYLRSLIQSKKLLNLSLF
jgi:hypothetical protein